MPMRNGRRQQDEQERDEPVGQQLGAVAQTARHGTLDVEHRHAGRRTHREPRTRDLDDAGGDEQVDVLLLERPTEPAERLAVHLGVARDGDRLDAAALDDVERVVLAAQDGDARWRAAPSTAGSPRSLTQAPTTHMPESLGVVADVLGHVAHRTDVTDEKRRLEPGPGGALLRRCRDAATQRAPVLSTSITGTATATTARENGTWRKNEVHASRATRKPAARKTAAVLLVARADEARGVRALTAASAPDPDDDEGR